MVSVLRAVISGFILTEYISTIEESYRYFHPFCHNNSFCEQDCICENNFNCNILPMDHIFRNSILYYHNHLREVIGSIGRASGMTLLEYDLDLEQISICWASKCINKDTHCFFTPRYTSTSQSVTQILLEKETDAELVIWMREMNEEMQKSFTRKQPFSHNLAQICSDKILAMGCAWSLFSDNWLILVCTYGPSKASQTELIYQTGPFCSSCPVKYYCNYQEPFPGLCKPKRTAFESLQENVYSTISSVETPPRLPLHPRVTQPTVPQSTEVPATTFSQTTLFTISISTTVETKTHKTAGSQMRPPKKAGDVDEHDDKKEKLHNWLVIGTILTLLVLALICAVTAVCIYTHGFGCR